ncbi:MAG: GGDEF domain-containing protein [Rubrivivax sp.]
MSERAATADAADAEALLAVARAALARMDNAAALQAAQAAWERMPAAAPGRRSDAALMAAKAAANGERSQDALDWAERAADAAGQASDLPGQVAAWVVTASVLAHDDRPRAAMQALGRVLGGLTALSSPRALMGTCVSIGLTYGLLGLPRLAVDAMREALQLSRTCADAPTQLHVTLNLVAHGLDLWDLIAEDDPAEAERLMQELRGHCAAMESATGAAAQRGDASRANYCLYQAGVHRRDGRQAEARAVLEGFLTPQWNGQPGLRAELWLELALARRHCGDEAGMADCVALAAAAQAEAGEPHASELPRLALIEELSGRPQAALALWRRHQRRLHLHVVEALEARIEDLGVALATQSLKVENAQLRSQAEGLTASVHQLAQLATTDPLTGVANRRALMQGFAERFAPLAAGAGGAALALIDLDHFKAINDRHTHGVGDAVLQVVAGLLVKGLRSDDLVGRYGGEEFLVLLARADAAAAARRIEALLAAVRAHDWETLSPGLAVSFSAGVVPLRPGEGFDDAVARADLLLYQAKRGGRCRVVVD